MPIQTTNRIVRADLSFDPVDLLAKNRVRAKIYAQDWRSLILKEIDLANVVLNDGRKRDGRGVIMPPKEPFTGNVRLDCLKAGNENTLLDIRFFPSILGNKDLVRELLGKPSKPYKFVLFDGTQFWDLARPTDRLFVLGVSQDLEGQPIWGHFRLSHEAGLNQFSLTIPNPLV